MTIEMTEQEIKDELLHWTVYGMIEGGQDVETAYNQSHKYLEGALEVKLDKEKYFTTEFVKLAMKETERFADEEEGQW